MKVALLGAGVIGITTARYLAPRGAEVVVLARQCEPGMETSYPKAGELN
jgi:D-amino-acid dehydrogenase